MALCDAGCRRRSHHQRKPDAKDISWETREGSRPALGEETLSAPDRRVAQGGFSGIGDTEKRAGRAEEGSGMRDLHRTELDMLGF